MNLLIYEYRKKIKNCTSSDKIFSYKNILNDNLKKDIYSKNLCTK